MTDALLIALGACALVWLGYELRRRPRFDPRIKPRNEYLDPHKR